MGGFTEQIVKHRKEFKDLVFQVVTVFVALVVTMYSMEFFVSSKLNFLFFLIIFAAWYFAYRLVISRNTEYEYTIMNHDFIVESIRGKRKRKTVLNVNINKFDICAAVADKSKSSGRKKVSELEKRYDCTGDGISGVYFIEYQGEEGTVRVLIQPDEKILNVLSEINPRNVFVYNGK